MLGLKIAIAMIAIAMLSTMIISVSASNKSLAQSQGHWSTSYHGQLLMDKSWQQI